MPSAEHVQTLIYDDDLSIAASRLQHGITKVDKWLREQGFQLSSDKSVFMMFTRKKVSILPSLYIGDSPLTYVTKYKFLSLIFLMAELFAIFQSIQWIQQKVLCYFHRLFVCCLINFKL